MSRSIRMFQVIQTLRNSRIPVTATQIADSLEVSKRTVYRDIASLQAMQIPIYGEAGIGYELRKGFDLPPLMFSQEEFEAISVGMAMLGRTGDKTLQRAAETVVDKISALTTNDDRWVNAEMSSVASTWHQIPKSEIDPTYLRKSVREGFELQIQYKSENGTNTTRTIMPICILYYIESIVVAAWCTLRNDFRHFRLDRITDCSTTGELFIGQQSALNKQWQSIHRPGKISDY